MDSEVEKPSRTDEDYWASDKDLFQLDVWAARHSVPIESDPIIWSHPQGTVVRDSAHLAALISALGKGEVGTATGDAKGGGRRGQVKDVSDDFLNSGYVVEVHNDAASDVARRVFRGLRQSNYPQNAPGPPQLQELEVFDASRAAGIVWSFLHSGLPVGYVSTLRHLGQAE